TREHGERGLTRGGPIRPGSLHCYRYRLAEDTAGELLRLHRLGEEEALDHVEADRARGYEFGARLDAFGHRTRAEPVGELDDAAAGRLPQPVVAQSADEGAVDLDLDEGELVELHQQRPFRADIVDRHRDVVQLQPARRAPRQ